MLSSFHRKGLGYQANCKVCLKEYQREYYRKHPDRYQEKNRSNKARQRAKVRALIDLSKGAPCADCGKQYPPWVMDLDHRPGTSKVANVGDMYKGVPLAVVAAEIAKCDPVCANCHRERTHKRKLCSSV